MIYEKETGRPHKITTTPQTPASTVVDEFSNDTISKRLKRPEPRDGDKRVSIPGRFKRSP